MRKRVWAALLALTVLFSTACTSKQTSVSEEPTGAVEQTTDTSTDSSEAENDTEETSLPEEHGSYTSKEDVLAYLVAYGHLPDNFITKSQAGALGWEGGSLEPYAPGMCIGGDTFKNYDGKLPSADGRTYLECDIDTLCAEERGAKRIVYSNDGLIYYTDDHYETFILLYEEEPA